MVVVSEMCFVWDLADESYLQVLGGGGDSNAKTSLAYIQLEKKKRAIEGGTRALYLLSSYNGSFIRALK
jgi:hypothetical protein